MTITFVPGTTGYGTGALKQRPLSLTGRAQANTGSLHLLPPEITASGDYIAVGNAALHTPKLSVRAAAVGAFGLLKAPAYTISAAGAGDLIPVIGAGSPTLPLLTVLSGGSTIYVGDAYLYPKFRVFATNATSIGRVRLPLNIVAHDSPATIEKQAILVAPGALRVQLEESPSLPPLVIRDGVKFSDDWLYQPTWVLLDSLGLNDFFGGIYNAIKRIADQIGFNDKLIARLRIIIAEVIGLHGAQIGALAAALRIRDKLGMGESPIALVQSLMLVRSVFRLLDASLAPTKEIIAEAISFIDSIDADVLAKMLAGDQLGLSMRPVNTLLLHAIVSEQLGLHAHALTILTLRKMLESGIEFAVTLATGDEGYSTWVMNAESQAFMTYENYPFNSYAQIGDQIYGATDDGIYLLEGDDDAGDPIAARLRTGLMNFGSNQSKRMEKFYAGMTTDGTMLLKVVTTSPEGDKIAYTYRMNERPVEATQEKRISIGRGLQSVYWQFELTNEDGADFEIADMSLLPMVLASRVRRS